MATIARSRLLTIASIARSPTLAVLACIAAALLLSACQTGPSKEEIEAARETIDCHHANQHYVIRFTEAEARVLLPDAKRVILYQVPAGSGVRYMNGDMELRGKGLDMTLFRYQGAMHLDCKPFEIPKERGGAALLPKPAM